MLQIIEQTPMRLVLRDHRRGKSMLMVVFTGLSAGSVILLTYQGFVTRLGSRLLFLLVFIGIGTGFTVLGAATLRAVWGGITLILDKTAETAAVKTGRVSRVYPIYAVSHLDVQTNHDIGLYGLFLVLRSGESIAISTLPQHERDQVEKLVRTVRSFLH